MLYFVPNEMGKNSPSLPPKNLAGIRDVGNWAKYFTSTPAAGTEVMWSTSILTANIGAGLLLRATDMSLQIVRGTSGIYAMNGTSSTINWVVNTWYHIAVTYTSATATANYYVNGASYGSSVAAESRASGPPTTTLQIGRSTISPFFYMTGYISNLRIVNGVKVYTGAFTPPAGPFTSIQYTNQNGNPAAAITGTQTNLLLNTPNGAGYITDTSTNAYTITNNGTATSQSLNPWSL